MISKEQLLLFPKKIIEDQLAFTIPSKKIYADGICTWEELLKTSDILPSDIVQGLNWREDQSDSEGNDIPVVVVLRQREETDEEYLKRLKEKEEFKKSIEEYELREYERLKLKYEHGKIR